MALMSHVRPLTNQQLAGTPVGTTGSGPNPPVTTPPIGHNPPIIDGVGQNPPRLETPLGQNPSPQSDVYNFYIGLMSVIRSHFF